jgi:pyruvate dehydrogenase E2 component (dihydrolipoamide acetyltransferase)
VKPGDVLCGIETDKAVVDFEMQEQGYVAKILYPAGTKELALGKTIAILVDNKDDIKAFANYSEGTSEPV